MKVRAPSKIIIISISMIVAFSFLVTFALLGSFTENDVYSYNGVPRAAILDQLNDDIPNKAFQEKARGYLEEAGYEVEVFTTQQLTVDFYKTLPKMNYEFIVVRSHAIGSDGPDYFEKEPVSIFTGEKYADNKYIQEQLLGQLGKGAPYLSSAVEVSVDLSDLGKSNSSEGNVAESRWSLIDTTNPYFLVGSKYVDDLMEGRFPNSVIVLAGCSTLSNPTLAKSFTDRGASLVVGWDRLVGSDRNDRVTLAFLENVLIKDMKVDEAIQDANKKFDLDSESDPNFAYYDKNL